MAGQGKTPPTKGNHLSNWAEGLGTPWSRPSRRAGSPSSGGQYQQEAPGTSLDPGQSDQAHGEQTVFCVRGQGTGCVLYIQVGLLLGIKLKS